MPCRGGGEQGAASSHRWRPSLPSTPQLLPPCPSGTRRRYAGGREEVTELAAALRESRGVVASLKEQVDKQSAALELADTRMREERSGWRWV